MIHFLHLPPNVLRLILSPEAVDYRNFVLCRDLLPYTLEALYCDVHLCTRRQIRAFAAVVLARPHYLQLVRGVQFNDKQNDEDGGFWVREGPNTGSGQVRAGDRAVYDPSTVVLGIALLRELVYAMPNLESLFLADSEFHDVIRLSTESTYPSLQHLTLGAVPPKLIGKIFARLKSLPQLNSLTLITRTSWQLSLPLLSVCPVQYLPPRSLKLEELVIIVTGCLGPETRHLFMHLRQLKRLSLIAEEVWPTFAADLAILPSTLDSFSLAVVGKGCTSTPLTVPKVDLGDVLASFPTLQFVELVGRISLEPFSSLAALPLLRTLHFGPHVALDGRALLSFLDFRHQHYLPFLESIKISMCHCRPADKPDAPNGHKWTQWQSTFQVERARKLLKEAAKNGIRIEGDVVQSCRNYTAETEPESCDVVT
ncbi:hypothetical protein JCM8097_009400 [Rhodosporidiobolus ruineniae]